MKDSSISIRVKFEHIMILAILPVMLTAASCGAKKGDPDIAGTYLIEMIPKSGNVLQWHLENLEMERSKSLALSCEFYTSEKVNTIESFYKKLLNDEKVTHDDDYTTIDGILKNKSRFGVGFHQGMIDNKNVVIGALNADRIPFKNGKHLNADEVFNQEIVKLRSPKDILVKQAYRDTLKYGIRYYSKEKYKTVAPEYEKFIKKLNNPDIQKDVPVSSANDSKMYVMKGVSPDGPIVYISVWEWDEILAGVHYNSYVEITVEPDR